MPKRKAADDLSAEGSDLSPPPNDLEVGAIALANENNDPEPKERNNGTRKTARRSVKDTPKGEAPGEASASTRKNIARSRAIKAEEKEAVPVGEEALEATPKKNQRKLRAIKQEQMESEEEDTKPAPKGRAKKKADTKPTPEKADGETKTVEKPAKKKRKTKEEKEAEAMPLAARTVGHKLFIGAHVSSAGGQYYAHIRLYSIYIHSYILFFLTLQSY